MACFGVWLEQFHVSNTMLKFQIHIIKSSTLMDACWEMVDC
jgi:hypothetical protein